MAGAFSSKLKRFKMLRNASECFGMLLNALRCDLVAVPFIRPLRPHCRPYSAPHGGYTGPLGCRSRPVSAIQRAAVTAPTLIQASATPCKTLQSASICFNAPCKKMQYFATECFEMLHFVSFKLVHPRDATWVRSRMP